MAYSEGHASFQGRGKNWSITQMENTGAQDHNYGDGRGAANSKTFELITEFWEKHRCTNDCFSLAVLICTIST